MAENLCLKYKYGNCGPLLEGEAYCLFHKPGKNKAEAEEFYAQLKKQANVESVEATDLGRGPSKRDKLTYTKKEAWHGYEFPADDGMHFFREATFEGKVSFAGATFEGDAYFGVAKFKDEVSFRGAIFEGEGLFLGATFKGEADFKVATFEGEADFSMAKFKDEASFRGATFEGEGLFLGATFKGEADFKVATFEGGATFLMTKFKNGADFVGATFEGDADFVEATFEGKEGRADFAEAKFKDEASFEAAIFEGEACFKESTFKSRASFIDGACVGAAYFSNVVFDRTCTFSKRTFGNFLFFNNCDFHQGVVIEDDWQNPESNKYIFPQAEQEGCRAQKISYEKEGRREAAEVMFLREMRARREDRVLQYEEAEGIITRRKKPLWEKERPLLHRFLWANLYKRISARAEYLLVDLTSSYGTSWQKVVVTALIAILFFTFCYFSAAHLSNIEPRIGGIYSVQSAPVELSGHNEPLPTLGVKARDKLPDASVEFIELLVNIEPVATVEVTPHEQMPVKNFIKLLYFSAATFGTTGYGDMHPVGLMKLFVTLQSFLGVFFGALFVVVFARKWMR